MSKTARWMRSSIRTKILIVTMVMMSFAYTSSVGAHTQLVSTTPSEGEIIPTAPEAVELRFNEPVEPVPEAFLLVFPDGTQGEVTVESQRERIIVRLPTGLTQGSFLLGWRVVSADGHPVSGTLGFSVGIKSAGNDQRELQQDDNELERLSSIIRGVSYLSLLIGAGMLLCQVVVLPKGAPSPRSIQRVATVSAIVAILGSAAELPLSVARQRGLALEGLVTPARWPNALDVHDVRAFVVLTTSLIAVLIMVWFGKDSRAWHVLIIGSLVVALVSPTLAGHTNTYGPVWLLRASNGAHLIAGGVWIGGLICLLLIMRAMDGPLEKSANGRDLQLQPSGGFLLLRVWCWWV